MAVGEYAFDGKQLAIGPHPNVTNPVFDGTEADDIENPEGAADPFIVFEDGVYYAFVETFGEHGTFISYYESPEGLEWEYGSKILGDGVDMFSYPLVKKHESEWFMTPTVLYDGKRGSEDFPLYRATSFPEKWELVEQKRITDHTAMDASPFEWNGKWYVIAQDRETDGRYGNCRLYYADNFTASDWTEHPESPIVSGPNSMVRGYPIPHSNHVDVFIGWEQVFQYRIKTLSPRSIHLSKEKALVRETWEGWNARKMHHVDARLLDNHNLIIADGRAPDYKYSVGIYAAIEQERPKRGLEKARTKTYQQKLLHRHVVPYLLPLLERVGADRYAKAVYRRYFE
jgi:hypothetical protein